MLLKIDDYSIYRQDHSRTRDVGVTQLREALALPALNSYPPHIAKPDSPCVLVIYFVNMHVRDEVEHIDTRVEDLFIDMAYNAWALAWERRQGFWGFLRQTLRHWTRPC